MEFLPVVALSTLSSQVTMMNMLNHKARGEIAWFNIFIGGLCYGNHNCASYYSSSSRISLAAVFSCLELQEGCYDEFASHVKPLASHAKPKL